MSTELEERLRSMSEEADRFMRADIHCHAAIARDMMTLSEGAGPIARALALRVLGNDHRLQGRLPEALEVLKQSIRYWRKAGVDIERARTKTALLPVLVQLGRHKEAIRTFNQGLEILLRNSQPLAAARLCNNGGAMYGNMGRPLDALRCLAIGEEQAVRGGDENLRVRLSFTRALVLQQLGRHEQAISACVRPLQHALRSGERVTAGRVLQAGAIALFHLGRFGKALRRFARARAIFVSAASQRDVSVCDLYICHCYIELNRYDQALARVRTVLESPEQTLAGFQLASARLYEGVTLARLCRTEEALHSMHEANRWFETHGHAPWAGKGYLEESQLHLAAGSPQGAVRSAVRAARLFRGAHMPVEEARASLMEAEAHLIAGRADRSEQAAAVAYDAFRQAHMPVPTFRCLQLLGRIAMERGDREQARNFLKRAIQTAEKVRSTVQVAFRRSFLDDKSSAYADLVWLHLQDGKVREAHRLADRAKSRALVDEISVRPDRRAVPIPPEDQRLWAEIEAVRREYQELSLPLQLGPEEVTILSGGAGSFTERRAQLEKRLARLWDEWELRQTAQMGIRKDSGKSQGRHSARLPEGGCMVEYFVAGAHLVAFVSDRSGLLGWVDLGMPEPIRRGLELLQLNLDAALLAPSAPPPGLVRNAKTLLGDLYRRLWEPLLPMIRGCRHAVIIPHGILHQVPFEALYDGERYLVQQLELSLAPSRETWVRCLDRAAWTETGGFSDMVAGYDAEGALPYVNEEVRWVAGALKARPLLGSDATGSRLVQAGSRRLVHLAVHGEFRADNPHFSTLLLSDGPFTVADAAALRLNASLVVLSSCETGISRVTPGEELQGMISAFLAAGCASVLASRWRIDDQITADLMQSFYNNLLVGHGKAAALREAQAAFAVQDLHPLCWAAFALVGHGGQLASGR